MENLKQAELLKKVREIIDDIGGIDEPVLTKIGITLNECIEPTNDTIVKLYGYKYELENQEKERLSRSL